jgi:hypothetical protein
MRGSRVALIPQRSLLFQRHHIEGAHLCDLVDNSVGERFG